MSLQPVLATSGWVVTKEEPPPCPLPKPLLPPSGQPLHDWSALLPALPTTAVSTCPAETGKIAVTFAPLPPAPPVLFELAGSVRPRLPAPPLATTWTKRVPAVTVYLPAGHGGWSPTEV